MHSRKMKIRRLKCITQSYVRSAHTHTDLWEVETGSIWLKTFVSGVACDFFFVLGVCEREFLLWIPKGQVKTISHIYFVAIHYQKSVKFSRLSFQMLKNKIKSPRLDTVCVCDTHSNNKLVEMPVVSNLKNLFTFCSSTPPLCQHSKGRRE